MFLVITRFCTSTCVTVLVPSVYVLPVSVFVTILLKLHNELFNAVLVSVNNFLQLRHLLLLLLVSLDELIVTPDLLLIILPLQLMCHVVVFALQFLNIVLHIPCAL